MIDKPTAPAAERQALSRRNAPIASYGAISSVPQQQQQQPSTAVAEDANTIKTDETANNGANNDENGNNGPTTDDAAAMLLTPRLRIVEKLGYGLGHVFNDLSAGVWFSYTLLFMQGALGIASAVAGGLVMVGQVGDALATPIIGYLADRHGTKRQWHIGGTVLVLVAFPLIFSWCPGCDEAALQPWWQPTYFTVVILVFQLGWATVQITHLAMIPEIGRSQTDRSDLTAIRYAVSVCSSVVVYVVMWLVLSKNGGTSQQSHITAADAFRFRDVALILTLIGCTMSVFFHFSLATSGYSTRRRFALDRAHANTAAGRDSQPARRNSTTSTSSNASTAGVISPSAALIERTAAGEPVAVRKNFFRSPLLYQNALLYVFSRLFCTTALVYMPLWLDERSWTPTTAAAALPYSVFGKRYSFREAEQRLADSGNIAHIAIIPLVSFVASFVASIWMKLANRCMGPKMAYLVGSVASLAACLWVALAAPLAASALELCLIAVLFGAGSSVTMISSLCITADMIGQHADQSGFIYSAVTFADKLITGVVVIVIEALKCNKRSECPEYYRQVLAYACGTAACMGLLTLVTMQCQRGRRLNATLYTRV